MHLYLLIDNQALVQNQQSINMILFYFLIYIFFTLFILTSTQGCPLEYPYSFSGVQPPGLGIVNLFVPVGLSLSCFQ